MFIRKEGPPVADERTPTIPEKLKKLHGLTIRGILAFRQHLRIRLKEQGKSEGLKDDILTIKQSGISDEIKGKIDTGKITIDPSHPSDKIIYLHLGDEDHIVILPEDQGGKDLSEADLDKAVSYKVTTNTKETFDALKHFIHDYWDKNNE